MDRHKVAIVCSARSGSTKALGTTNLLLRAASEALQRPQPTSSPPQSGAETPLTDSLISRSSRTGSPPGTPDSFPEQCPVSFSKTVDLILSEHIAAARACVKGEDLLSELETEIVRDCENLRAFLSATQVRRPWKDLYITKQALKFGGRRSSMKSHLDRRIALLASEKNLAVKLLLPYLMTVYVLAIIFHPHSS